MYKKVVLQRQTGNAHMEKVIGAMEQAQKDNLHLYKTYVREGGERYTFLTTSKNLHLEFGRLSEEGLYHLAKLLEEGAEKGQTPELVLCEQLDKERDPNPKLFATLVRTPQGKAFHVSFAH